MEAILLSIPDKNSQAAIRTKAIIDQLRAQVPNKNFVVEHSFEIQDMDSAFDKDKSV